MIITILHLQSVVYVLYSFLLRQNIAGEAVTVLFSAYQPDIKSVRVCLKISIKIQLIQESFLHKAQRKTHKSKLYYLKDKPILDIKIPNNWIPERKYVDKEKNNQWLISRGKKPEEQSDLWGFDFVQFSVSIILYIFVINIIIIVTYIIHTTSPLVILYLYTR